MPFSLGTQLVSLWVWGHAIELPEGDLLRACYSREGHSISGLVRSKDGASDLPVGRRRVRVEIRTTRD